ncbi:hypothetical protein [Stenotrophomonas sp. SORGH_AS_0321]|uniref:hypothetical protein n=1 Tax=Stenotrophomonas sp. SORGH_AS_0321 TaxID=3041787 RepID=UPI0028630A0D|nr:hypothetical protein [Stenotrophomonas sp. SORGH_AS_0321]MDR6094923.1 hypothetical protein [Stenotrophomonas sp. SORGH_AS_0321]
MEMHPQLPLDVLTALIKQLADTGLIEPAAFLKQLGVQRAAASMTGRVELAESHRAYEELLRATVLRTDTR